MAYKFTQKKKGCLLMAYLTSRSLVAALALTGVAVPAVAQEVNVYSSRHYDTDEALYDAFTEETGITVNRIEADADELIARLEAEGENSPADVLITVDAGRMARAEELDLLAAYESQTIEDRIPDHLEHPGESLVRHRPARAHHLLRQGKGGKPTADL